MVMSLPGKYESCSIILSLLIDDNVFWKFVLLYLNVTNCKTESLHQWALKWKITDLLVWFKMVRQHKKVKLMIMMKL